MSHAADSRPTKRAECAGRHWTVTAAAKYAVVSAGVPVAALPRFPQAPLSGGPSL